MGIVNALFLLPSLWLFFFFFLITTSYAQIVQTPYSSPPPPPPPPSYRSRETPFRPTIAVVVAILATLFSVTFLLLLYAKHCKRGPFGITTTATSSSVPPLSSLRKNSGVDRTVIESLPVFRFGSLRGQKAEGLECAVCLNKFEPTEILRLLPKCKHAFHVECVDTWLDAHSTCPLCRYRVDPEDILLVSHDHHQNGGPPLERKSLSNSTPSVSSSPVKSKERILSSGRHSSAGERGSSSLQIIVETPKEEKSRMSLDSWKFYKKKCKSTNSLSTRKDAILLPDKINNAAAEAAVDPAEKRRLEHRIIISGHESDATSVENGAQHRWSDVEASDMLYLRSEMLLLSESGRYCGSRRWKGEIESSKRCNGGDQSGRRVINERCVSEMTGMSRFKSNEEEREREVERQRQRRGAVTRWLAWISQSQSSLPAAAASASTSATT